ncbi:MAG: hypothetical protein GW779_03790 [Candidatus Altiarchaeum hamiconexum]|uniref:Carbohydrate kinase PfkB domain-containing protein n=1 Tax=Candidatus Altarchaeum hamiconexum TaxID=1803513 RepID=A0A8J8CKL9_9ARCH|nr:hypothetical protein [Candidatus Altarchaeum hamiconexum]OIQ05714.1 MAG: hypothetical protein AUK59_02770 [Candidatus Altarchaeum sp. CG2_30_32_3053]PIN67117.1 MAG: hypothetical protein COV98_04650 [Candidatus Altarchaeum sp. CG12_big_fil_rev_8_21_14_0_65_33_22]PIV28034.1 MAG: hypothetical protein COS36_03595 [Candidatus Altarchaeum sp. CG03_land_8_20_14_0_80_32_618]PIX49396.1 MAG: hypothetical protein COZ53_00825 [Candidatus Altarchaeum sp. CG_4_8_14_3_um_filter_33_2054]PIZ33100.1 MAG: hyp
MKNNTNKVDLLVFGDMCIDYFYKVDNIPSLNESAKAVTLEKFFGGMGANTAVAARKLGLDVDFFSIAGHDANDYISYLQNLGIRLNLKAVFGETTHSLFFKNQDRFISFFYKGVSEKVEELAKDVHPDIIENAKCVYLARTYLNLYLKVVKLCKKNKNFVVFNPGYGIFELSKEDEEKFRKILKSVDVFVVNEEEYKICMEKNLEEAVNFGNKKILIITKGANGADVITNSGKVHVDAYETKAVNESGAGDAFNAGFIAAHMKNFNLTDCVRLGNATASFVVENYGCQTSLIEWNVVIDRFNKLKKVMRQKS